MTNHIYLMFKRTILISNNLILDGCSLPKQWRINEATHGLSSSCAQKCLQEPFCAGYNFKNIYQKKKSNCQLARGLNYSMNNCNNDDKGWVFYHLLGHRKVSYPLAAMRGLSGRRKFIYNGRCCQQD